jgi:hypothetical protein
MSPVVVQAVVLVGQLVQLVRHVPVVGQSRVLVPQPVWQVAMHVLVVGQPNAPEVQPVQLATQLLVAVQKYGLAVPAQVQAPRVQTWPVPHVAHARPL